MGFKNLLFAAVFILTSCTGSRYISSKVKVSEIKELEVFRPLSFIALVDQNNISYINDSISSRMEKIITKLVFDSLQDLPKLNPILTKDDFIAEKIETEIIQLCLLTKEDVKIKSLPISPWLDKTLESRGKRFGLIVLNYGFTRTKADLKAANKNAAIKSITETLIMNAFIGPSVSIYINIPSRIYTNFMIIDSEKNNITFFNTSVFKSLNVLDVKLVKKHVSKLVSNYFKKIK